MLTKLPYRFEPGRELGRTGFHASQAGICASKIEASSDEHVAMLRRALEAGLNVIDASPSGGEALVGRALRDLRLGVFVIARIERFDRPVSSQVDSSLHALGLKTIDLVVFSGLSDSNEWSRLCKRGGPMQELAVCVSDGKCRFRGVSSDSPEVLLDAIGSGLVDAVVFPLFPDMDERFARDVLPRARQANVGTIGACAIEGDAFSVDESIAFALALGPDVALLAIDRADVQERALRAVHRFDPLSDSDVGRMRRTVVQSSGT